MDNEANIFENEYAMVLLYLCLQRQTETGRMLSELDEELRYSNRFFPNNKLLEIIDSLADISSSRIEKGSILYRCRQIKKEEEGIFFRGITSDLISLAKKFIPNTGDDSDEDVMTRFMVYFQIHKDEIPQWEKEYNHVMENYSRPAFWGYDEVDSDAPPQDHSSSGRINPDGIRYLYASNDVRTAVLEVRPIPTQFVSVAQIEIIEDINIYSFTNPSKPDQEGKDWFSWIDYSELSKFFALPNYGGSSYYFATQYISEYIKHMKTSDGKTSFDGLCFQSSLNPDGINYVLFDVSDTKKYRICNSSLHQVDDLIGNSTCILPYIVEGSNMSST